MFGWGRKDETQNKWHFTLCIADHRDGFPRYRGISADLSFPGAVLIEVTILFHVWQDDLVVHAL